MTSDEVVPALLRACPTALAAWNRHLQLWGGDERGLFNDVAVFANHIVGCLTSGDAGEFPAFFRVVEKMIVQGDVKVRELAVTGLIEDIQNIASHRPGGYKPFESWLQPAALGSWLDVEAAWQGVGSLAQMIRRESSGK
jgi:hypothetical protein